GRVFRGLKRAALDLAARKQHVELAQRVTAVLAFEIVFRPKQALTDMVPASPAPGTFDWLVGIFKRHQKWKEIDHKTQRLYEQGLALFANHKLKDDSRAGSKQISDFTKAFVDAIYAKLLVVEAEDADGNIVKRERRRFAN